MREAVVMVHGIWLTGVEFLSLKRQLAQAGFEIHVFHYHSLIRSPEANADKLNRFVASIDAEIVHFVGHSLGGIVVSHLFHNYPLQRPGRVVMLGTPLKGSAVAQAFHRVPVLQWLLGRSVRQGLLGHAPRWKASHELAMIAGNRGIGIGMLLFGALSSPNDGTVALAETKGAGIQLHVEVPYSHFGMLFSTRVAEVVVSFLRGDE